MPLPPTLRRFPIAAATVAVLLLGASCTHPSPELSRLLARRPLPPKPVPATTLPADAAVDPSLVADYRAGDGEGYNLALSLHPDGTFDARWSGCLGTYATATGVWARSADRVTFVNLHATDQLDCYLCHALVVPNGPHAALILEQDEDTYRERGVRTIFTLHLATDQPYWLPEQ